MSLVEEKKEVDSELKDINILEAKTLLELLLSEEIKKNINFPLNDNVNNVINKVLKHTPDFLNDIEKAFVEIVKDNKIDSNDIPNLIVLVQKLYELIYKAKDIKLDSKKTAEVCGSVLKFIIHVLVEERKIKIDEEKKIAFLELTDKLIDSCVTLLSFSRILKGNSCLKKIFG
jgi:hypothetical protein